MIAAPGPVHPWPIGLGARYQPTAANDAVMSGRPVGALRCTSAGRTFAVHVELFARRRVIVVPGGIGAGPPGCRYPLRTTGPTGVVDVDASRRHVLGDLFRIWGRRLTRDGLLSFTGRVSVYVGGRRFRGDPRSLPLRRHAQIVVEIGGYVSPHPFYLFPKGR